MRFFSANISQIYKNQVDKFSSGRSTPSCEMRITWTKEDNVKPLAHAMVMEGAKDEHNFLRIESPPDCTS